MTLLTATPNLAGRRVALTLAGYPEDGRPIEIWRQDVNGRRRVRLPLGATTDAGAFAIVDHEAALVGPITYTADDDDAATSLEDATRPDVVTVHTAAYPTTRPQASPEQLEDWRPTRDAGAQLHWPIGRRDPIDTGGPGRLRELAVTFRCEDWLSATALEDVLAPRPADYTYGSPAAGERTIVVRQSTFPGLDVTMTVTRVDGPYPDPASTRPRRWRLTAYGHETYTGPPILEAGI